MKSFIIAWKDLKIRLIDRRGFMMMLIMPLLLTAILGSALSNVFENGGLPKTVIGYYQVGTDEFADVFQKDVLQSKELKDDVKVKIVSSQEELEDMLKQKKIDVGIVIPNKWSEQVQDGKLKEPKVFIDPLKDIQAKIAESMIRSFSERVQTVAKEVSGSLQAKATTNADNLERGTIGKKTVAAMQYYAAAMLVMFLLYNITVGAKSVVTEQRTETLARLFSTPTSSFSILFGKFLGTLLFACIQFGIFIVATHFMFHVEWGGDFSQIVAVGISYAICVSGLSMLIAAFIREEKTADVMGGIGIQILAILGGSMLPIYVFPDTLQTIANVAPNKWALTSFLNIMSGTSWDVLLPVIFSLCSAGIVSVMIGTLRLRTR